MSEPLNSYQEHEINFWLIYMRRAVSVWSEMLEQNDYSAGVVIASTQADALKQCLVSFEVLRKAYLELKSENEKLREARQVMGDRLSDCLEEKGNLAPADYTRLLEEAKDEAANYRLQLLNLEGVIRELRKSR